MTSVDQLETTDGRPSPVRDRVFETLRTRPVLVLTIVLLVLVVVTTIVQPSYLSVRGLRNTLIIAVPLALVAGSQTMCMLTGGIDLSVAITATGAAYVAGSLSSAGTTTAILLGLAVGLVVGFVNGVGVGVFKVHPIIMTLGMSSILLGLFTSWAQGLLQGSTTVTPTIRMLGAGTIGGVVPVSVVLLVVAAGGLLFLQNRTGLGRMLFAVGDNEHAARLAGVRSWQVILATYVLASLLAAVAGILLAGRSGSVDLQLAGGLLMPSVAAAVIGGTSIFGGWGGYAGTLIGALILGVLTSLLTFLNAGQATQQVIYGGIVLALAILYSRLTKAT